MAPRRRRVSALPSSTPITIGNCEVIVEAKKFTSESNGDTVQIFLSNTAKIRISVVEKETNNNNFGAQERKECGDFNFVLANPKDSDNQTKSLLQEVLSLYKNELPEMNYAANTGKRSMFLERCITNGKYCTLLLKAKYDTQSEWVIAAITYQIIPSDTQYAEIPLAAVRSSFQRKGIGRLLYLELRRRLQSVGICTLFCWGDQESEGFWLKQGFKGIGEVDKKGRAHRLPIKADVRRALCFPGGSTLMTSHLLKHNRSESVKFLKLCSPINPPELNYKNQEQDHVPNSLESPRDVADSGSFEPERLVTENLSNSGGDDLGFLPVTVYRNVANASGMRDGSEDDKHNHSGSQLATKKRIWESSWTSLKSKKVKGTHSNDYYRLDPSSPIWSSDGRIAHSPDANCLSTSGNKFVPDIFLTKSGSNGMHEKDNECRTGSVTNEDFGCTEALSKAESYRIMLMNIVDGEKKSRLSKIIEDLGGVVASEGTATTHVVTGKARKTLNFCTALCSGAWVVSPAWLKESFKKGEFVEEMPFILVDDDYRNKYMTELKTAVLRAKAHPRTLLKGFDIWLAKHVQPPVSTLSAIVKSAGGNVIRTNDEVRERDASKTIFVACEEDMEETYLALKVGMWAFSSDWLMNSIMKQQLDFDAPRFAESL